ncbi:MAG: hypothetical protein A2V63_13390 [Candidatus Eisenbacteria bacterium RBG_19FT_COMBO_70_11]|nr:MAG: hypothetical protein A2V63_13390 [Candidatus Eisenbacteria bacterium RBG_19FT_COMBO_70_11]
MNPRIRIEIEGYAQDVLPWLQNLADFLQDIRPDPMLAPVTPLPARRPRQPGRCLKCGAGANSRIHKTSCKTPAGPPDPLSQCMREGCTTSTGGPHIPFCNDHTTPAVQP